jgi:hypothetical protein
MQTSPGAHPQGLLALPPHGPPCVETQTLGMQRHWFQSKVSPTGQSGYLVQPASGPSLQEVTHCRWPVASQLQDVVQGAYELPHDAPGTQEAP